MVKSEKTGTVTLIGINRAEVRNCINSQAAVELSSAIDAFENDVESPIAVLYGVGGNFCAGYDLRELSENQDTVANVLLRSEGAMVSLFFSLLLMFIFSSHLILGTNTANDKETDDCSRKWILCCWWSRISSYV